MGHQRRKAVATVVWPQAIVTLYGTVRSGSGLYKSAEGFMESQLVY